MHLYRPFFKRFALVFVTLCSLIVLTSTASMAGPAPSALEAGFRQMYNLDFAAAHCTFEKWKRDHPADPLGAVANAAAYLFSEFDRLDILDLEYLAQTKSPERFKNLKPDVGVKAAFEAELATAEDLSHKILAVNGDDPEGLFAKLLSDGLRGDYAALVENRKREALSLLKSSRITAEKLLAIDPSYHDAYLAIGIENYVLGLQGAPTRWFLRLSGAETNRQKGIEAMQITAQDGRYLSPFARVLLSIAAFRDQDLKSARTLLDGLTAEFPQNRLYRQQLARLRD
jgi:hypothetical protein